MYRILFMSQAQKDAKKIAASDLKPKVTALLEHIAEDPYAFPPPFEKLKGDMAGLLSRRINKQHRLVYEVFEQEKLVKVYRMWTHYE